MIGVVEKLFEARFGFLMDENGVERFFHFSNVLGPVPERGSTVSFEPYEGPRGSGATRVRDLALPETDELLREIASWKLEAKLEDTNRYFFTTPDVRLIESGEKCFVIGRKGTGKTAISEHLTHRRDYWGFSRKLTFKNFPFNELYALKNDSYTAPNQYITLWKLLIYSCVAQMMVQDEAVDISIRQELAKVYDTDSSSTLARSVSKWTSRALNFSILGIGAGIGPQQTDARASTWIDRVEWLEALILEHGRSSSYLVVFDELDEDYKSPLSSDQGANYSSLITSLFKAVQDVKAVFRSLSPTIVPVVFLREDVFSQIRDPDRTKWADLAVELEWNTDQTKQMLAFRITRAAAPENAALPFDEAWVRVFDTRPMRRSGDEKVRSLFSYISRSTMHRPRDYIRYLQVCSSGALARGASRINGELVSRADKDYSSYLRSDIEDELGAVFPDASTIFELLTSLGKIGFRESEFSKLYEDWSSRGKVSQRDPRVVLEALHHVSALGTHTRDDRQVFRYINRDLRPDFTRPFCIHRGLYKALSFL